VAVAARAAAKGAADLDLTVAPVAGSLDITVGRSQLFSVHSRRAPNSPLQAQWFVNGTRTASGQEWSYTPGPDELGAKEVKVVVTDAARHSASQTWHLRVLAGAEGIRIVRAEPVADGPVHVEPQGKIAFAVDASAADGGKDGLTYRWFLNGSEVTQGRAWEFLAPAVARKHHVEVRIADAQGAVGTKFWTVIVESSQVRPAIVAAQPESHTVNGVVGEPLTFIVKAELDQQASVAVTPVLRYQWRVDGGAAQATTTGEFQLQTPTAGKCQLSVVAVSSQGLKSRARSWLVDVRERQP
jgi:hypothetical protein